VGFLGIEILQDRPISHRKLVLVSGAKCPYLWAKLP
jgi:hypothetical protein